MMRSCYFFLAVALFNLYSTSVAASDETQTQDALPSLPVSKHCVFAGEFVQSKNLDGLAKPLISSGSFYYDCERGVIWKSEQPMPEVLVFRKTGKVFAIDEQGETRAIKSKQSKVLGRLLNNLIGADFEQLADTFELEQLNDKAVRFIPKKRRLKRAIKMVDLMLDGEDATAVEIKIIDRNEQLTQVSANQTAILPTLEDTTQQIEQCSALETFSNNECQPLMSLDAAQVGK